MNAGTVWDHLVRHHVADHMDRSDFAQFNEVRVNGERVEDVARIVRFGDVITIGGDGGRRIGVGEDDY